MEIIWNGHSCFTVKTQEGSVVLDPYEDGKVPGLGPLRLEADAVLCSHVSLTGKPFGVRVEAIPSWHDEVCGRKRGSNTIHVLYAEGMKLVHLGDLGTELNREQIETLAEPDILLIPIGGYYTINAAQALEIVEQLRPRVTVPMHFRRGDMGYDVIATPDEFLSRCPNVVEYPGNTLTVDLQTPAQTAVLSL